MPGRDRLGRVFAALAFSLALAPGAQALEPSVSLAHYGYDAWDSDSGLPQNSVNTILQTRDGYLWLGTQEGLVRFDGVHFRDLRHPQHRGARRRLRRDAVPDPRRRRSGSGR